MESLYQKAVHPFPSRQLVDHLQNLGQSSSRVSQQRLRRYKQLRCRVR